MHTSWKPEAKLCVLPVWRIVLLIASGTGDSGGRVVSGGRSFAGFAGWNPSGAWMSVLCVVCFDH